MNPLEKAYIAGLVDGDGSFGVYRNDDDYFRVCITITSVHKNFLEKIQKIVGAGTVSSGGWRIQNRQEAFDFINEIIEYLILKEPQARLVLVFCSLKRIHHTKRHNQEKQIANKLKELKHV